MKTYSDNSGVYEDPDGEWMKVEDHGNVEFANKCMRKEIEQSESQDKKRIAHVEKLKEELNQERRKSAKWEAAHGGLQAAYTGVCEAVDIEGAPWRGHPQDKPLNYRAAMEQLHAALLEVKRAEVFRTDMINAERVADNLGDGLREASALAERLECETEQKVDALKDEIAKLKDKEIEYQNTIGQRNGAVGMLVKALEVKEAPVNPFASSMWFNEIPKVEDEKPEPTNWAKFMCHGLPELEHAIGLGRQCGKTVATELATAVQVVSVQLEELKEASCLIKSMEASIVAQGEAAVKQQEEIEDLAKERYRLSLLVRDFREKFARIREVSSDVYAPESERDF